MRSAVSKVIGWCVFVVGMIGAAYGIVSLHVEMSVFWLIVASTSGLPRKAPFPAAKLKISK